jgi:hypothetical protein
VRLLPRGYAAGYRDGVLFATDQFERVLAVLREELADARAGREAEALRAHGAVDELLRHIGKRLISPSGRAAEAADVERRARVAERIMHMPDPTDDQPFGTPDAQFRDPREALIGDPEPEEEELGAAGVSTDESERA